MSSKNLAIYYLLLLLLMVLWTNRTVAPPVILRVIFFVAVLLPGTVNRHGLFLAAMSYFWTASVFGYAYSFMPTMTEVYLAAVIMAVIFYRYKSHYTYFGSGNYLIPLLLVIIFISDTHGGSLDDILFYVLLIFLLAHFILPEVNQQTIKYFQLAFMAITIVLSLTFLSLSDLYAVPDEMGNIGWNDQNYMGMVIGFGASIGVANCLRFKEQSKLMLIMSIVSIIVAVTVMLLLASRGALLCLVVSVVLLLILSTGNMRLKFFIVLTGAAFLLYLYTNEYFDLLEKRFELEDGTISQRSVIWSNKWNSFFDRDSLLELFIGVGREIGASFGAAPGKQVMGFHNDFLAFFVCYGLVGLSLFVAFLIQPLRDIHRHSPYRDVVIANVLYLVIGCISLEPFFLGYFPFYAFLMYTMLLTRMKEVKSK